MALESIADLVRSYGGRDRARHACHYHPEAQAVRICRNCGRNLCSGCSPVYDELAVCRKCRRPLAVAASWLSGRRASSGVLVVGAIVVFSLFYLLLARGRFGVLDESPGAFSESGPSTIPLDKRRLSGTPLLSPGRLRKRQVVPDKQPGASASDKRTIERRNWLYLVKAARSKKFAEYLSKKKRADLARRRWQLAAQAFEEVLRGMERQHGPRFEKGTSRADREIGARAGGVLVALAGCYAEMDRFGDATAALERAIRLAAGPSITGLAHYRLGLVYEEGLGDCAKAISAYKASQSLYENRVDHLEEFLREAEKPPQEKRYAFVLRHLLGTYDPAHVQSRIIGCYRSLGLTDKVEQETDLLIERYPFSTQAAEARKERGEPESPWEGLFGRTEPKEKQEETLKIIPLEE